MKCSNRVGMSWKLRAVLVIVLVGILRVLGGVLWVFPGGLVEKFLLLRMKT